jgi:hypothetical protein
LRFFDEEMSVWVGAGEDAETQDVGDDERRFAGTIHAVVGELVGGSALRMQGAKAGFVAEQRPSGHGHATRKQSFDGRIEPDNGNALRAQKFRRTRLGVGAAAECKYGGFAQFERAAEGGAELRGFQQAEGCFAVTFEKLGDAQAGSVLDALIEINETPGELAGQLGAYGRLAGTHESGEGDDRDGRSARHAESLDESAM